MYEKKKFYASKPNIVLVLGELENDPAERTVAAVDPANLNQVILAEGKQVENTNQPTT